METNKDIRAGYRVPEGYFADFANSMASMSANKRKSGFMVTFTKIAVSVAAVLLVAVGIFSIYNYTSQEKNIDITEGLANIPYEVLITHFCNASESDIVNYFYNYSEEEDKSDNINEDDIINYYSGFSDVNLYALIDNM